LEEALLLLLIIKPLLDMDKASYINDGSFSIKDMIKDSISVVGIAVSVIVVDSDSVPFSDWIDDADINIGSGRFADTDIG